MKAFLKNYRQSPRKVRLVANLVRGKRVEDAVTALSFLPKRAGAAVAKLIRSAETNAVNNDKADRGTLFVKSVRVDQGNTLKRFTPGARGRAFPIRKRTSRILVTLETRVTEPKAKKTKTKSEAQK